MLINKLVDTLNWIVQAFHEDLYTMSDMVYPSAIPGKIVSRLSETMRQFRALIY